MLWIQYVCLLAFFTVGAGGNLFAKGDTAHEIYQRVRRRMAITDMWASRECGLISQRVLNNYNLFSAPQFEHFGPESDSLSKRSQKVSNLNLGLRGGHRTKSGTCDRHVLSSVFSLYP